MTITTPADLWTTAEALAVPAKIVVVRWLSWWLHHWWWHGAPARGTGPTPAGRQRRYGTDHRGRSVTLACAWRGEVVFRSAAGWAGIESSATLSPGQSRWLAAHLGVRRAHLRRGLRSRRREVLARGCEQWLHDQGLEPSTSAYIESWDVDLPD